MAIIKTFSLCIVMLSSFNLFTMEHEMLATLANVDSSAKVISTQEIALNKVWDSIDRNLVGVSDCVTRNNCVLASLVGTCLTVYKGRKIKPKQSVDEMNRIKTWIESAIESDKSRCCIFKTLVDRHWYVQYLMQALVDENVHHLECVTGNTIDELYDKYSGANENKMQDIAIAAAYKKFFDDNLDKKKLTDIMPLVMSDIHFTVLYHPNKKDIKPDSLKMSSDGKYLRAADERNIYLKLEMETGKSLGINGIDSIEWISGKTDAQESVFGVYSCVAMDRYKVVDKKDMYYAQVSDAYTVIDSEFFKKEDQNNPQAIILFKRPQKISYLCQKAFDNSYGNSKELQALRDSRAYKSVEGFPKENLARVIENRIKQLTNKMEKSI
jgi:hypothetical protein